jgi:hypothetical protein
VTYRIDLTTLIVTRPKRRPSFTEEEDEQVWLEWLEAEVKAEVKRQYNFCSQYT